MSWQNNWCNKYDKRCHDRTTDTTNMIKDAMAETTDTSNIIKDATTEQPIP